MHEKLTGDLRDWASLAQRHGQPESAELLTRAAESVASSVRDPELAVHLQAYAIIAEGKGQNGFAGILTEAAQTVA